MKKNTPHKKVAKSKKVFKKPRTNSAKKFKVFDFVKKQPVPDSKIDSSEGITVWETAGANDNNNFPQQLLQNVYNSPAGSAAIDIWHEFVEGGGFVDQELNDLEVNRNETLSDLNSKVSADLSSMWGCSVVVSYGFDGQKKGFKHLPFEETRLGELNSKGITDKIFHNPYYGTGDYDKEYTKMYYAYNPDPEVVKTQIAEHRKLKAEEKIEGDYPGQVFWFSIERPMARVYPQPFYYSTILWFKIDAEIQKFHERNITNNFLLSVLINKFGNPDEGAGEPNADGDFAETVGEIFNKEMSTFAGAENGGSALVEWFTREEEKSTITAFPNNSNHDLFIAIQETTSAQISIGTKVPRILIGIGEGGKLGDTQEILNAIRVMQGRTARMRKTLSSYYTKLLDGFSGVDSGTDTTIKKINPVDILPDWVVATLNQEQKEKYISENFNIQFKEKVKVESEEEEVVMTDDPIQAAAQAGLKGSVGGVQGILSIQQNFSDGLTSESSALAILKLIYGFTDKEARALLGSPKTAEEIVVKEELIAQATLIDNFRLK